MTLNFIALHFISLRLYFNVSVCGMLGGGKGRGCHLFGHDELLSLNSTLAMIALRGVTKFRPIHSLTVSIHLFMPAHFLLTFSCSSASSLKN